ncbi:RNA polymerase sigma factor [Thalassotalea sp. Y01]|uniref:RNA polymerase sigma factor n=1 Tax=Thalassotalea sp. Y01 TaxID=2729613 RepID=UPI00145FC951|nr:RNA polymerase sigma factor [Thalassotalea sp. Y01]NMP17637.1 RNA polymerase sigma factor [Thalassotalea sp. Y01]
MARVGGFSDCIEIQVIEKAKAGDVSAFEVIYRQYSQACFQLALRMCANRALAQDITQEVFVKVFRKLSTYHGNGSFAGWLRQIAVRESLNRLRVKKDESPLEEESIRSDDLFNSEWVLAQRDLTSLLSNLPGNYRSVLILHEVEGFTHQEIAEMLDKSVSFSKVTLLRAYKKLQAMVVNEEAK